MSVTAFKEIRDRARIQLQDLDGNYWSDDELDDYINRGQREYVERSRCLTGRQIYFRRAYGNAFNLPDDYLRLIKMVDENDTPLVPVASNDIPYNLSKNQTGQPVYVTTDFVRDGFFRLYPIPEDISEPIAFESVFETYEVDNSNLDQNNKAYDLGDNIVIIGSQRIEYFNKATGKVFLIDDTLASTKYSTQDGNAVYVMEYSVPNAKIYRIDQNMIMTDYYELQYNYGPENECTVYDFDMTDGIAAMAVMFDEAPINGNLEINHRYILICDTDINRPKSFKYYKYIDAEFLSGSLNCLVKIKKYDDDFYVWGILNNSFVPKGQRYKFDFTDLESQTVFEIDPESGASFTFSFGNSEWAVTKNKQIEFFEDAEQVYFVSDYGYFFKAGTEQQITPPADLANCIIPYDETNFHLPAKEFSGQYKFNIETLEFTQQVFESRRTNWISWVLGGDSPYFFVGGYFISSQIYAIFNTNPELGVVRYWEGKTFDSEDGAIVDDGFYNQEGETGAVIEAVENDSSYLMVYSRYPKENVLEVNSEALRAYCLYLAYMKDDDNQNISKAQFYLQEFNDYVAREVKKRAESNLGRIKRVQCYNY